MALRVRFQTAAGASLGYSIERLADGTYYDFSDGTFRASPVTAVAPLSALSGPFTGQYSATLNPTPIDQFSNGEYTIGVHDLNASSLLVGLMGATLYSGDDAPVFPPGGDSDPWATLLPGSYPAGTAGFLVGSRLDAPISSRSTYAGGPVASVTAPVTVGTNADKAGYSLATAGLDAIFVEPGINARQALAPILAAAAGSLSGAGTGTVVIRGGGSTVTRVTATTDAAGNRTSVVLALPS